MDTTDGASHPQQQHQPQPLRLNNSGSDCFLISSINLIDAARPLALELAQINVNCLQPPANLWLTELSRLLRERNTNSVAHLRRSLPNDYHAGQQDAGSVLHAMLQQFEDVTAINELASFQVLKFVRCGCEDGAVRMAESPRQFLFHIMFNTDFDDNGNLNYAERMPFADLIRAYTTPEDITCMHCGQARQVRKRLRFTGTDTQFFFVAVQRFIQSAELVTKVILSFCRDPFHPFIIFRRSRPTSSAATASAWRCSAKRGAWWAQSSIFVLRAIPAAITSVGAATW